MGGQPITTKSDLERFLHDKRMEAKALPLSLLKCITNNFSDEHEIGRGGFAVVYKGQLVYSKVAVKQLIEKRIDEDKFIEEINCLMKAKHKNIVRFLGYCSETQAKRVEHKGKFVMADNVRQRLLCFEYVPNGTLDEYIQDVSREWGMCYEIIKGVCEGLRCLHKEGIVHLDLKPANILLDDDMVPKITDFGISRCFGELQTHVFTTNVKGTLGYLAPELHSGIITFEADIYSLGVIITEMLTGAKGHHPNVEKVQEHWRHKLEGSHKELQLEQIQVCTEVAESCLEHDPEKRPSAQTIIDTLEQNEREEWFPILRKETEPKPLSLSLLKCITNNFSRKIGSGGFADVYKGQLKHREVAVKKLSPSRLDENKFIAEIHCLMKLKHKNIVRFLGYCSHTQGEMVAHNGKFVMEDVCERWLCFEYVPNGSLDEYINDASREWGKCYKIIKGVCEGLHYLHKERIVHRDLKPANILLDNDMVPKISDFGISRCFDELQTHVATSKIVGTLGYLAPELFHNGKITFKSDIYSLGIIIMEILTGAKGCPEVEEVQEHWSQKLKESQKELQLEQIRVCIEVAQTCLQFDPKKRPSAQEIIDILVQNEREEPKTRAATAMLMTCKRAILKIYAQDTNDMSMEELYRVAYNLVLGHEGGELYSAVETAMVSQVQSLCRPLDDADPADSKRFLQELLTKWDSHIWALGIIRQAFNYMDSSFVPVNGKTPTYELGLRLWRDEMARSSKIRQSLIEAVKRQKGGEDELVPGVNKMLTELGADVKDMLCLCFHDSKGVHAAGP